MSIYRLIQQSQEGDESATIELLKQFCPLLKKYARMTEAEDTYEDLRCFFLELMQSMNLAALKNTGNGVLISYIASSVRHEYILRAKKQKQRKAEILESSLSEAQANMVQEIMATWDDESHLFLSDMARILSAQEQNIIFWTCVESRSSAEIAKKLGVTRQNINQMKKRALHKLCLAYGTLIKTDRQSKGKE